MVNINGIPASSSSIPGYDEFSSNSKVISPFDENTSAQLEKMTLKRGASEELGPEHQSPTKRSKSSTIARKAKELVFQKPDLFFQNIDPDFKAEVLKFLEKKNISLENFSDKISELKSRDKNCDKRMLFWLFQHYVTKPFGGGNPYTSQNPRYFR